MKWKTINTGSLLEIQYVEQLFLQVGDVLILTQKLGENIFLKIKSLHLPQYHLDTRDKVSNPGLQNMNPEVSKLFTLD